MRSYKSRCDETRRSVGVVLKLSSSDGVMPKLSCAIPVDLLIRSTPPKREVVSLYLTLCKCARFQFEFVHT